MVATKYAKVARRARKAGSANASPNELLVKVHGQFENYLSGADIHSQRQLSKPERLVAIDRVACKLALSYPYHPEVLNLVARVSLERGDSQKAEDIFLRALESTPESASNNFSLGQFYLSKKQYDKAIGYLTKAMSKAPQPEQVAGVIAFAHLKNGNTIEAYIMYRRLCFNGDNQYNAALVQCLKRAEVHNYSKQMENDLVRVLDFEDVDFNQLSSVASSLLIEKYNLRKEHNTIELSELVSDELLKQCLQKMVVSDVTFEKFVWLMRASLLQECVDLERIPEALLDLIYSIGTFCDANEYVLSVKDSEDKMVQYLLASVAMIIKVGNPIDKIVGGLALLSMYMPVSEICDNLDINIEEFEGWHATGDKLRLKGINDAKEELKYLELMNTPEITVNPVEMHSMNMQRQYEDNPYPRWDNISKVIPNDYIRALKVELPELVLNPRINQNPKDVLVAGCGTGRHAVQLAWSYPKLNITALDISRRSLAYGMKKADDFKLLNLKFKYQNLLNLKKIGHRYEAIECSGVLHHLESPEKGLAQLVGSLKDDGILKLGLYSSRARQHVLAARELIAQHGLKEGTLFQIRKVRSEISSGHWGAGIATVALSSDFYTTSGCRDLLFHFHEVGYTPSTLKLLLAEAGLKFLGFTQLSENVRTVYLRRFQGDVNLVNLDNWEQFEEENPFIFTSMYQFYCCKD